MTPGADSQSHRDLTTQLIALARVRDQLPPAGQRAAERIFARPTTNRTVEPVSYGKRTPKVTCNKRVCVHWVKGGKHRATKAWAKQVRRQVTSDWKQIVNSMGYRKPASDRGKGNPRGVKGHRLDVYLGDIDSLGIYGYAVPENARTGGSYLVLDNDYRSVSSRKGAPSRKQVLRVSSAHEFFHVVQFAHKVLPDPWLAEATATWIEEQLHDGINDNRQYLALSALTRPAVPLDSAEPWFYGNWIFFEHLSQRFGPKVVHNIWKRVGKGRNTVPALKKALKQRGSTLAKEFTRFAASNTIPAHTYAEGAAYPRAKPAASQRLGTPGPTMGWRSATIDHLAASTLHFLPEGTVGPHTQINVEVRAPRRIRAELIGRRKDGQFVRQQVRATPSGSTLSADFNTDQIAWVAVTVANTGVKHKHDDTAVQVRAVLSQD